MATVEEIMNDVLREVSHASGRNVQLYMQDRIGNKINQLYRSLFTQFWWDDLFKTKILTLTGTGDVTTNMRDEIIRVKDVHSVYLNGSSTPLPWITKRTNVASVRSQCLHPAARQKLPFSVLPADMTGQITVNYRTFQTEDFQLDDEVPLDRDLMVLGVATNMLISDGLNDSLAGKLGQDYQRHLNTLVMSEVRDTYKSNPGRLDVITEWTER